MNYGLRLVSSAAIDPVSLAEARAHCRIDESADDGLVAGYIMAARSYIENATGLSLITQTWEMTLHDWPHADEGIVLPRQPVQSITSVQYYDTSGALQTLSSAAYEIDTTAMPAQIKLADGYSWPQLDDKLVSVIVRFVAGYGSSPGAIPEAIRHAILLMVGHFYANREQVVVGSGITISQLQFGVDALIAPYKVHGF